MKCIDFDKQFSDFTTRWVRENAGKYKNVEEMEAHFPDVYSNWLVTPADWLGNKSPALYFAQYDDAKLLVKWMRDYFKQGVSVPDLLLDRISELADAAPRELLILLRKPERDEDEAKLCAIGLMSELESDLAFDLYIDWIARGETDDDLAERAADAMAEKADAFKERLLAAYEGATEAGRLRILDILSYMRDDERIYSLLAGRFEAGERRALFASYLLKYGDERALPLLKRALNNPDVGYLDYIEIRNAVEGLGDAVETGRDFAGDPDYEALRNM